MPIIEAQTILTDIKAVAATFAGERAERQRRRELDPADFARLAEVGLLQLSLPVEYGGLWEDVPRSTRPLADAFRTIAHGDSSVSLVATMHPAVLWVGGWMAGVEPPPPYREAWAAERAWVLESAKSGAWWATIQSEPGSGGDNSKTTSGVRRAPGTDQYRLTGVKHFGSGTGIASYMITQAVPDGESVPELFVLDMRGVTLDGSGGAELVAPWDGHGMIATQSHMIRFTDFPPRRAACPEAQLGRDSTPGGLIPCLWAAVTLGIVEVAMETATAQLARRPALRAYEAVEWARAQVDAWVIAQIYEGMLRATEEERGGEAAMGKIAMAELAESVLQRVCRVIGGSTFGRGSPFGFWFEDVRALGFLRPPWGLAYDRLTGADNRAAN